MNRLTRMIQSMAIGCCVAASFIPVRTGGAQTGTSISVNAPDSVSFIVRREGPWRGEPSIRTLSREAELILRDSVVILQLTDYGLDHFFDSDTDAGRGGSRLLKNVVKAGLSELLDHGIAYRIPALQRAYADGSRLVLQDRAGKHVFETTNYNDHHPMVEFDREDASWFADAVNRAIARQHRTRAR